MVRPVIPYGGNSTEGKEETEGPKGSTRGGDPRGGTVGTREREEMVKVGERLASGKPNEP